MMIWMRGGTEMKKLLIFCVVFLCLTATAFAGYRHGSISVATRSEVSLLGPFNSVEYPFLNLFKNVQDWVYADNSGNLTPLDIDANGYPVVGGPWVSKSGAYTIVQTPSQSERPGHYVAALTGAYAVNITYHGTATLALTSCSGGVTTSGVTCDNTGCSSFTGSIAGTTLTVTAAPTGTGCSLAQNVPITWGTSGGISTFGTPTIITSAGSACGPNTCYTVNQSQTVASTTMYQGLRVEWSTTSAVTTTTDGFTFKLTAAASHGSPSAAVYHLSDESSWLASASPCAGSAGQACIAGTLFKTRLQQAKFGVLRNLDWMVGNNSNCSTWSSRKPIGYYTYGDSEYRNAASGNETYIAGGQTYTIPKIGQYVNAAGTGASGGTVSYSAGTDTYSVTLGTGAPVDKQTFHIQWPATGTLSSKLSLNGNTAISIAQYSGDSLSPFGPAPTSGSVDTLFYDAAINAFLRTSAGLVCSVPPEVFIEINAELGTTPWNVLIPYALDPMTDFTKQYGTYLKNTYTPPSPPIFETQNEPWNCPGAYLNGSYLSRKSQIWISKDTAWQNGQYCGSGGNAFGETAKMTVTAGQDLNSVYGAGNYEILVSPQTQNTGSANDLLQTPGYVGQNPVNIPTQTGYTQDYAYKYATRLSVNNYWTTQAYQLGAEVGYAYCYQNYSVSSACQSLYASQAAAMTAYMNTANTSSTLTATIASLHTYYQSWKTYGTNCSLGSRPAGCTVNSTKPMMFYEGGYNPLMTSSDFSQPIFNATNATSAVLSIQGNGCVAGQSVAIAGLTGGTWSTANGNYTVSSGTTNTCTINLNSTGLGTFGSLSISASGNTSIGGGTVTVSSCTSVASGQSIYDTTTSQYIGQVRSFAPCSGGVIALEVAAVAAVTTGDNLLFSAATLTYTGSKGQINYLRNASYLSADLDTLTTSLYNQAVSDGGVSPSQYFMAGSGFGDLSNPSTDPWFVFAYDIYGYYPVGQCTSCTIASTTLTLGGTVTGVFRVGDTLFGSGVTGLGTGAGSNTTITSCTPIGSNACGTTAGDTLGLSQSSTVASGVAMTGNATPPTNNAGNSTTSPVRAWGAICRFNGNGSQCNG